SCACRRPLLHASPTRRSSDLGLATIALALSIPATTATGDPFPGRSSIVVAAVVVLLVTLVLAGLTFPAAVNGLGIDDEAEKERRTEEHTSELQSRFDLVCRLL